jgi:hypothetical protein
MAGDYYSLEEVIEKLGKTEDEIKKLVSDDKLHEFRDGANTLYKVEEVDALISEISELDTAAGASAIDLLPDDTGISTEPIADLSGGINLGDLTGADTTVGTTGINVLGDTDDEYKLSDDSQGETQIVESEGSVDQLGSLDGDLSMDSVGSGSGLLDLSLQADDTSLGAVLDDILPAIGEGAAAVEDVGVAEEADKIFEEAEPEAVAPIKVEHEVMPRYIQPEPDAGGSNSCGIALIVPLLAMIYAAIVLVAGFKGIAPAILKGIEGIIWYVATGLAVVVLCIIGFAALLGGKKGKGKKAEVYQQSTEAS